MGHGLGMEARPLMHVAVWCGYDRPKLMLTAVTLARIHITPACLESMCAIRRAGNLEHQMRRVIDASCRETLEKYLGSELTRSE